MPYDEDLANRIRELLGEEDGISEKKMFGGLAFLVGGHMSVCASGSGGLLARIERGESEAALKREHVTLMQMGGRTMRGWLRVAPEGLRTKRELASWVRRSVAYARTLAPK
jgi:TfoX/Sxy family transcriptional regulator of competence genes